MGNSWLPVYYALTLCTLLTMPMVFQVAPVTAASVVDVQGTWQTQGSFILHSMLGSQLIEDISVQFKMYITQIGSQVTINLYANTIEITPGPDYDPGKAFQGIPKPDSAWHTFGTFNGLISGASLDATFPESSDPSVPTAFHLILTFAGDSATGRMSTTDYDYIDHGAGPGGSDMNVIGPYLQSDSDAIKFTRTSSGQYFAVTFSAAGLNSSAVGPVVTIDGYDYTFSDLPITFNWPSESVHTYEYAVNVSIVTATRGNFTFVSSNGPGSPFTVTGVLSIAGMYAVAGPHTICLTFTIINKGQINEAPGFLSLYVDGNWAAGWRAGSGDNNPANQYVKWNGGTDPVGWGGPIPSGTWNVSPQGTTALPQGWDWYSLSPTSDVTIGTRSGFYITGSSLINPKVGVTHGNICIDATAKGGAYHDDFMPTLNGWWPKDPITGEPADSIKLFVHYPNQPLPSTSGPTVSYSNGKVTTTDSTGAVQSQVTLGQTLTPGTEVVTGDNGGASILDGSAVVDLRDYTSCVFPSFYSDFPDGDQMSASPGEFGNLQGADKGVMTKLGAWLDKFEVSGMTRKSGQSEEEYCVGFLLAGIVHIIHHRSTAGLDLDQFFMIPQGVTGSKGTEYTVNVSENGTAIIQVLNGSIQFFDPITDNSITVNSGNMLILPPARQNGFTTQDLQSGVSILDLASVDRWWIHAVPPPYWLFIVLAAPIVVGVFGGVFAYRRKRSPNRSAKQLKQSHLPPAIEPSSQHPSPSTPPASPPLTPMPPQVKMRLCPKCGRVLKKENMKFCPNCGTKVE